MRGFVLIAVLLGYTGCGSRPNLAGDGGPDDGPSRAMLAISPPTADFTANAPTRQTFTITNTGVDVTGAIALQIVGTDSTSFVIAQPSCSVLTPGGACTVDVLFAPHVDGDATATLTVSDGQAGAMADLHGNGNAMTSNGLRIVQGMAFENTAVGNASPPVLFTVTNLLSSPTGKLKLLTDPVNPQFGFFHPDATHPDTCSSQVLPGDGSCTFYMTFEPKPATGTSRTGSVTVSDTANQSASLGLSATVGRLAQPSNSGVSSMGSSCASPTPGGAFTFTNETWAPLDTFTAAFNSQDANDFTIRSSTCTNNLAAHTSCTIVIATKPLDLSATSTLKKTTLVVTATQDNAMPPPVAFPITISLTPCELFATPSSLTFPATATGASSGPMFIQVTNNSVSPRNVVTAFGGMDAADFTIASSGCTPVLPGQMCSLGVTAQPSRVGTGTGSLLLTSPGIALPPIALTETGTAGLSVSPSSAVFNTTSNQTTVTRNFLVSYASTATTPTTHINIVLAGDAAGFSVSSQCNTLVPGGSCNVMVTYTSAGATGQFDATLDISATIPGPAPTVTLTGISGP